MPFISGLTQLRSLSIVGMAKNTGKTECLNYVLRRLWEEYPQVSLALTSIGIDGERRDQVTQTDKPEICLHPGTLFVTAEKFYRNKMVAAEVVGIDEQYTTSLGRAIYARSKGTGKVLIAGPASTGGLKHIIRKMRDRNIDLTIIDGALSRISLAAPSVSEGMILATGAAYSVQPEELIRKTHHLYRLIQLPEFPSRAIAESLADAERGMFVIDPEGNVFETGFISALSDRIWQDVKWLQRGDTLFVAGVVSDLLLEKLRVIDSHRMLVVRDFTRLFASPLAIDKYLSSGKELRVLYGTKLMAVTFNPLAPSGYRLDSEKMCTRLQESLGVPVYDVCRL